MGERGSGEVGVRVSVGVGIRGVGWPVGPGGPVGWPCGLEACWAGWSSVVGGFISFFFFIYLFFFWFYLILFYKL